MRTADVLQMAFDADPELMKETALNLALLQRIQPAFVPDVVADFEKISQRVAMKTKEAGAFGNAAKGVGLYAAGTVAAGLGLAVATDLYNAARRGLTSGRNFRRMMTADPELQGRDKKRLQQAFRVVQQNAPDIAADPLSAAALTARYMDTPDHGHDRTLREMLELQRTKQDAKYKPFGESPRVPSLVEPEKPPLEMYEYKREYDHLGGVAGTTKTIRSPNKNPSWK